MKDINKVFYDEIKDVDMNLDEVNYDVKNEKDKIINALK